MKLDFGAFVDSFRFMGIGLVGIFCVMGVIIGSIYLLNRFTSKKTEE